MAVNRVERLVINLDMQKPIVCNWDTCDRYGRTSHQVRLHEHQLSLRCSDVDAAMGAFGRHTIMIFCSDGHLDYWVASTGWNAHDLAARNRGRIYGQHSAGMKRTLL